MCYEHLATEYPRPIRHQGGRGAGTARTPDSMRSVREAIPLVRMFGLAVAGSCCSGVHERRESVARPRDGPSARDGGSRRARRHACAASQADGHRGPPASGIGGLAGPRRSVGEQRVRFAAGPGCGSRRRFDTSFDLALVFARSEPPSQLALSSACARVAGVARGCPRRTCTTAASPIPTASIASVCAGFRGWPDLRCADAPHRRRLFIRTLSAAQDIPLGFDAGKDRFRASRSRRWAMTRIGRTSSQGTPAAGRRVVRRRSGLASVSRRQSATSSSVARSIEGRPLAANAQPPASFSEYIGHDSLQW